MLRRKSSRMISQRGIIPPDLNSDSDPSLLGSLACGLAAAGSWRDSFCSPGYRGFPLMWRVCLWGFCRRLGSSRRTWRCRLCRWCRSRWRLGFCLGWSLVDCLGGLGGHIAWIGLSGLGGRLWSCGVVVCLVFSWVCSKMCVDCTCACTYYSVDISAPAKAKSQSCFLQSCGEVRPWWMPQFVRYSTQFGPPSAVAV